MQQTVYLISIELFNSLSSIKDQLQEMFKKRHIMNSMRSKLQIILALTANL